MFSYDSSSLSFSLVASSSSFCLKIQFFFTSALPNIHVGKHHDDEDNVDTVINLVSDRSKHNQGAFIDDDDLGCTPDQPCDE